MQAGVYDRDEEGAPGPGDLPRGRLQPAADPDRLDRRAGLYGIEDEAGNINYYNSGVLFGAIDVALFIIVTGGFLSVTVQTRGRSRPASRR